MVRWSVEGAGFYLQAHGRECTITLEPRPHYCDRGNWIAKVHPVLGSKLARDLDSADAWPRYYFDLYNAKLEIEAWLIKRNQLEESTDGNNRSDSAAR